METSGNNTWIYRCTEHATTPVPPRAVATYVREYPVTAWVERRSLPALCLIWLGLVIAYPLVAVFYLPYRWLRRKPVRRYSVCRRGHVIEQQDYKCPGVMKTGTWCFYCEEETN